jgi:hypothetical protein
MNSWITTTYLAFIRYYRFSRELKLSGFFSDCLFLHDLLLRNVMPERSLAIQQLVKNDSDTPHVNLRVDKGRIGAKFKALRRLVPIGTHSLRSQLNLFNIARHRLTQPEVRNLDLSVMKQDVLRFQVVVNDPLLSFIQVLKPAKDLTDNQFRFSFWQLLLLFQIHVQVWARAHL